ncbi:hypothetical protein GINT2_001800 [Glugoides intestinalis]
MIRASYTCEAKLDQSLVACTDKCVVNDVENIKECTGISKSRAKFVLFKHDQKAPSKICSMCFNKTVIIKTIEEESPEFVETVLKLSDNKEITFLKRSENGFFGVKAGKFYIIAVTNKHGTFFNRYRFLEIEENTKEDCFEPSMLFYKSVLEPEMAIFLYFSYFNGVFILKGIIPHPDENFKLFCNFIDYSTYLYYAFLLIFISWVVLIMVFIKRYISGNTKKNNSLDDRKK